MQSVYQINITCYILKFYFYIFVLLSTVSTKDYATYIQRNNTMSWREVHCFNTEIVRQVNVRYDWSMSTRAEDQIGVCWMVYIGKVIGISRRAMYLISKADRIVLTTRQIQLVYFVFVLTIIGYISRCSLFVFHVNMLF